MKKIIVFLGLVLMAFSGVVSAQQYDIQLDNKIYADGIASVKLLPGDDQLAPPVGVLGETMFTISFDDLNVDVRHLKYTFIHCTHDWKPDGMNQIEYLDGFMEDEITEYSYSFNTLTNYTHYTLDFPNEMMRIQRSGNYI